MTPTFEVKIYKTGGHFQTKYYDPKTGKRKRKRFDSLKEAKAYKIQIEAKVQNLGIQAFIDLRISQAIQNFLESFPNSTIRSRKNHFKDFVDTFGPYKVSEVTSSDIQSWMEKNKILWNLSTRTMNAVKAQFNGFFKHLKEEGYTTQNPLEKVQFKKFDTPRRKRVVLSVEEVHTTLDNVKKFSPDILYPYLSCVTHTGARRGEVIKLNREDIDFQTGLIHLRDTKNSHDRFVRISPTLETVLKDHLNYHSQEPLIINENEKRIQRGQLTRLINKFKAFFPLENKNNWGSHSLRHSFAYNFLKRGERCTNSKLF